MYTSSSVLNAHLLVIGVGHCNALLPPVVLTLLPHLRTESSMNNYCSISYARTLVCTTDRMRNCECHIAITLLAEQFNRHLTIVSFTRLLSVDNLIIPYRSQPLQLHRNLVFVIEVCVCVLACVHVFDSVLYIFIYIYTNVYTKY